MATEPLRAELEAAYGAVTEALSNADSDAFLAAVQPPAGMSQEAMRADFANALTHFRQVVPDLSATTFLAVRTEGDDFAGYYHMRPFPADRRRRQILLSRFLEVEGRWKLLLSGWVHVFQPDPDADPMSEALRLIEAHPDLHFRKPSSTRG